MKLESVKNKLVKEKEEFKKLQARKIRIDEQIKIKQKKIKEYEAFIIQEEYVSMKDILSDKGLTLSDVVAAVKTSDLHTLQERLEEN